MSGGKTGTLRAGRPSESRKATTLASLADKGPTVRINFDLERDEHRRLKMLAVQQMSDARQRYRLELDEATRTLSP